MEYKQMTLNEWVEIKQKLRQELLGIKQSFVRIGYMLRKIDKQKSYEQDGYKSIAEFAKKELGLHPSTTTRFMEINREYSIDGFSERLRPEYLDLGRSQLEEMLKLPDADRVMIRPEASRENIRELKRFNSAGPKEGADDLTELLIKFYKDNPDALNGFFLERLEENGISKVKELINPSGNRSYKMGLFFLMFYENKISVKKFGQNPINMSWEEFLQKTEEIFGEMAAGADTWRNYFGEEEDTGAGTTAEDSEENEHSAEKSIVEDIGGTNKDGAEKKKDDDEGEEISTKPDRDNEKGGTREQNEEKKEIAPAQKSAERLEERGKNEQRIQEENDESAHGQRKDLGKQGTEEEAEKEEPEPDIEIMNEPEVIEKAFGTRKDYLDSLTEYGAAEYLYREYKKSWMKDNFESKEALEKWLMEEVDERGEAIKE